MLPFYYLRAACAGALLLVAGGCKKADPVTPEPIISVSWTVDGVAKKKSNMLATITSAGTHYVLDGLFAADNSGLQLYLPLPLSLGTYPLVVGVGQAAPGQAGASYYSPPDAGRLAIFDAQTGTLTLTVMDNKSFSGTFAFTARCATSGCPAGSTRTIANGVFQLRR
jgi:hypothetical protein